MEFKFIDTVIENIALNLEVLEKDTNNYTMLLLQHKGVFSVSDDKIGNETDCSAKFSAFIELAKTENVSLAITPEYSCPWDSISQVIQHQDKWPNNSKLWAPCCESISPNEIKFLRKKHSNNSVIFHFDEGALNNGGGVFLDPICYLFKAQVDHVEKLIVLVQFKTQHMGVWETPIESEKYIWGNEIYVLRNNQNSVNLFTNICSEAAVFSVTPEFEKQLENRWAYNPYVILHPQLNSKPSSKCFKTFRNTILEFEYKDIISLNWGGGTQNKGKEEPFIPFSKSSILFKSSEVDYNDPTIFRNNHIKGLYYLNKKANNHAYYLNPYKEVFLIKNKKPVSSGLPQVFIRRTGPLVEKVFSWDNSNSCFYELEVVDDGFYKFLEKYNCNNSVLKDADICFIDKERLICLSCGFASAKGDDRRWYRLDKLKTFIQDENETVKRLTFLYDESSEEIRKDYIDNIDCLNDVIIPDETFFPENLKAFKGNCRDVMFSNDSGYKYNLSTTDGKSHATVAYIGRDTEGSASKTLCQMQGLFEKEDQSKKLVVVWYKENVTDIKYVYEQLPPCVNDDSTVEPNSIMSV